MNTKNQSLPSSFSLEHHRHADACIRRRICQQPSGNLCVCVYGGGIHMATMRIWDPPKVMLRYGLNFVQLDKHVRTFLIMFRCSNLTWDDFDGITLTVMLLLNYFPFVFSVGPRFSIEIDYSVAMTQVPMAFQVWYISSILHSIYIFSSNKINML